MLCRLLKQIRVRRIATGQQSFLKPDLAEIEGTYNDRPEQVLDEFLEIITLPAFDPKAHSYKPDSATVSLSDEVVFQLRDYVQTIAAMYKEHACE